MKYENRTIDFKSIKEMPSQERPRERLMASGPLGVSDLELLCLVIGSGNKNRPVQDIAQDILEAQEAGEESRFGKTWKSYSIRHSVHYDDRERAC